MLKATPTMPNRAPVPRFCTLYPTVAAAAFSNGLVALLATEALVDVAWTALLLVLLALLGVVAVAEAVSLRFIVTPSAAHCFTAKSSVSGKSVC